MRRVMSDADLRRMMNDTVCREPTHAIHPLKTPSGPLENSPGPVRSVTIALFTGMANNVGPVHLVGFLIFFCFGFHEVGNSFYFLIEAE